MVNENVRNDVRNQKESQSTTSFPLPPDMHKVLNDKTEELVETVIKDWKNYTQQERNSIAEGICEDYFDVVGEYPNNFILGRLTEFVLMEVHANKHPDKMTLEEYPVMTVHQTNRRKKRNNLMGSESILDFLHSKYYRRLPSLFKSTKVKIDS